ncbi:hypothetical protein BCD64_04185 [Nostoc sp. MBR 210]|nr:hypothetical protein BCD64_04185 [Nostoc sp. MBR 210]
MYKRQPSKGQSSTNHDAPVNQFAPRRFVIQPQTEEVEQTPADLQAKSQTTPINHPANIPIFPPGYQPPPPPRIQMKLSIGEPGDKYEQEADKLAKDVVQRINSSEISPLQAQSQPEEEDKLRAKPIMQRLSVGGGMAATSDLETSIQQARGSGQFLADSIREPMETAFGADFSGVKIHTDAQSDQLNKSIQAKAFTTGQDVFFRQGEYQPGSRGGQELIAHELTHVVQQGQSSIKPTLHKKETQGNDTPYLEQAVDTISDVIASREQNIYRKIALEAGTVSEMTIQREISEEKFITDTTSTFCCFSWRKGTDEQRNTIEGLLRKFEQAVDTVNKVVALQELVLKARLMRTDSDKFQNALDSIVNEGNQLLDGLEKSPEWIQHKEEKEKAQKQAADKQEQERLEKLGTLDWEGRVNAFKKQYGSAVVDTLTADTKELEGQAKLLKLTENFKNIGFQYTMKNSNYQALLKGTVSGDCNTLSNVMAVIVKEIFLRDAKIKGHADLLVTSSEKTIDPNKQPTGEKGEYWVFENHYWVEAEGKEYDPLFGREKSEDGWQARQKVVDLKELGLNVEDYGGDYKIVLLFGAGNLMINNVTEEIWSTHLAEANKVRMDNPIKATYQEMIEKVKAL